MFTLFSIPKAFRGHFKVIQTNAIRSWALLEPRPDIILFGDDEGTAEIAKEIGARHIAQVERNEYGTPLVNSIFAQAQALSPHRLMCYVNADIILMNDFMQTVLNVCGMVADRRFLLVGRKIGLDIPELLDFTQPDWESQLKRRAQAQGKYGTSDSDYFVFPKGLWEDMPPFAIGRFYWSAWLVYDARVRGATVVDTTSGVMAVESAHDYSHVKNSGGRADDAGKILKSAEVGTNARLFQGCRYWTTSNSSHILTPSGLKRSPLSRRMLGFFISLDHSLGLAFHADATRRWYLLPVHAVYRMVKPFVLAFKRHTLRRGLQVR